MPSLWVIRLLVARADEAPRFVEMATIAIANAALRPFRFEFLDIRTTLAALKERPLEAFG